jgi:pimeloyl-ACP methyl ester carboxylesterase
MPVLSKGSLKIDYAEDGRGQPVVLIHSSVSANRQWRALTEALKDRYRVLAVNLFGYGETTPWPGDALQSLYAQAQLILALCEELESPVHLVGHSFGSSALGSGAWFYLNPIPSTCSGKLAGHVRFWNHKRFEIT